MLAFNVSVTQFIELTTVRVIDDSYKREKSIILVVDGEDLRPVFAFVFVIHP